MTINVEYLQKVSRQIIDMHRAKQEYKLSDIYYYLFPPMQGFPGELESKKVFIALIKLFHPDTYEYHREQSHAENIKDSETLDFYQKFLSIEDRIKRRQKDNEKLIREIFSFEEEYSVEEDLDIEEDIEDSLFHEASSQNDIYSILSNLFFGNNNTSDLLPIDLAQIDGELILSDYEIEELEGLQHLGRVRSLDLSKNLLENIYELKFLDELEELDLSYNDIYSIDVLTSNSRLRIVYLDENNIDDISPLLELPSLEFVSLIGNPIVGMDVIRELQEKNVVVLYF